ncbi:D-glycero-beta-D-manno-heptose 1-phosphate adenylyltransferase [Mucilaginibacter psychrotolerans]|uniref:D-glycero-beta-D-manno-heptose 1-phosphate adenylyltransferase n=1 Tax=Mucilaginibacter psychrotolerans TaxID=1524096 RepID=A0A4Y8SN39_9SPHI|nr:D-glycero-beta-D-manno-heptose 1-phosphate adenylyltransferase [Mucilaginibacter psychrotolerans]TFF39824.1 D-glycero-beta-D-manno-heptose 1-phosphate adenylyltransferase [Mucilaginibacter psychrotolerans]
MEALEYIQSKLYHSKDIGPTIQNWKQDQQKVVFTNGVFDILHIGHISYLAKASELGDKLVIGLNADLSVKRLKGNDRPINSQNNRALLLAALFYVDAVVVFEEDTPQQLISLILPDVLVKGADYTIDNIVGAREVLANGGLVKTIEFVDGHSSTSLIQKMKNV